VITLLRLSASALSSSSRSQCSYNGCNGGK
jgi:hypothetical protein